jgi:hypothetical protein
MRNEGAVSSALADLLIKLIATVIGGLILAVLAWLAKRIWEYSTWMFQEKLTRELQAEAEREERAKLLAFRLLVEGNGTPEHPGLVRRIQASEDAAHKTREDLRVVRAIMRIGSSDQIEMQRERAREALALDEEPPPRPGNTGAYRAIQAPPLPPVHAPALRRRQTPHGPPLRREDDDSDKPPRK